MSTADLAAATRIRQSVIEAMEQDDFSACGGEAYAKGQLRSIARALGTDPELFVDAYLGRSAPRAEAPAVDETAPLAAVVPPPSPTRHAAPARPAQAPPQTVSSTPPSSGRDRSSARALAALGSGTGEPRRGSGFNWTAAMALAVVAVMVVGLVSFLGRDRGGSGEAPVAAVTTSAPPAAPTPTPTPTPTAAVTPSQTPSDAVAVVPTSGVTVTVTVTGDKSWLTVSKGKGGERLYDGLVTTGDVKTFTSDKKIRLVIGNSGAVSLTVNGKDLGAPAGIGRVSKLEFGPGDPAAA